MSIIKHQMTWFAVSAVALLASVGLLAAGQLKLGIDFTGGSLLEVAYTQDAPSVPDVRRALAEAGFDQGVVQASGSGSLLVRQPVLTEDQHQQLVGTLQTFGELTELRFDSIGPVIGTELRNKSLLALVLIMVAIILYVAWSFRHAGHLVASWKYGVVTVVAAVHDVVIAAGVAAFLGWRFDVTVGTAFVAALLTILGYSVNDTIVVFDRIRENLKSDPSHMDAVVDRSITQTMARSVNTSLTTLLALLAVYVFGGETIRDFVLILIVGIAVGTYSSIFIASPLLVVWHKRSAQE